MSYFPQMTGGTPGWNDPPANIGGVKHPHLNRRARPVDPSCQGATQQSFAGYGYQRQTMPDAYSPNMGLQYQNGLQQQEIRQNQAVPNAFAPNMSQGMNPNQSLPSGYSPSIQQVTPQQQQQMPGGFSPNMGLQYQNSAQQQEIRQNQPMPSAFAPNMGSQQRMKPNQSMPSGYSPSMQQVTPHQQQQNQLASGGFLPNMGLQYQNNPQQPGIQSLPSNAQDKNYPKDLAQNIGYQPLPATPQSATYPYSSSSSQMDFQNQQQRFQQATMPSAGPNAQYSGMPYPNVQQANNKNYPENPAQNIGFQPLPPTPQSATYPYSSSSNQQMDSQNQQATMPSAGQNAQYSGMPHQNVQQASNYYKM